MNLLCKAVIQEGVCFSHGEQHAFQVVAGIAKRFRDSGERAVVVVVEITPEKEAEVLRDVAGRSSQNACRYPSGR